MKNAPVKIKRSILLNPGPLTTTEAVKQALVVEDICPREEAFCDLLRGVREDLVRVAGGRGHYEAVPFGASGTGAVEACLSSVLPEKGKILIVNNGSYGERMRQIAEIYYPQGRVVEYALSHTEMPDPARVESLLRSDKEIGHVAFVHHETTTGMLNPAAEILRAARRHGSRVIVDAMSSFGGIPIDLKADDYDYLIFSSNKCLQGMPGVSFVVCRKTHLEELRRHPRRNLYLNLANQNDFLARTGQMPFTPPVQVIYALRRALDELFAETVKKRYLRYSRSWEVLTAGLEALGLKMLLPKKRQSRLLVAVLEPAGHPRYSFRAMHDYLLGRGITIYPGKGQRSDTFRISTMGDIDEKDIRFFLGELKAFLSVP